MPRYHAYTEYHDSIVSWDGDADSAADAAIEAAREYKIPGTFMVIQGTAVSVEIKQETTYVAVSTGSNGR